MYSARLLRNPNPIPNLDTLLKAGDSVHVRFESDNPTVSTCGQQMRVQIDRDGSQIPRGHGDAPVTLPVPTGEPIALGLEDVWEHFPRQLKGGQP